MLVGRDSGGGHRIQMSVEDPVGQTSRVAREPITADGLAADRYSCSDTRQIQVDVISVDRAALHVVTVDAGIVDVGEDVGPPPQPGSVIQSVGFEDVAQVARLLSPAGGQRTTRVQVVRERRLDHVFDVLRHELTPRGGALAIGAHRLRRKPPDEGRTGRLASPATDRSITMPTDPHDDAPAFASASEQAAQIRDGQVSSRDLTELYLDRIERFDAGLGSYVEVLADRARHAADAADEVTASGADTGPLHGVPVAIKDLNFLRGATTTMGTQAMADHVATFDDHSVARLIGAGAIPLGKTNVAEFGTIGHTATALLGRCATPWDTHRNAGGSSGGAGAALAAGLCALAHGSDGAGSIRIPAAINGLVGLKPSRDRVSLGPMVGDSAFGLSTPGALTRTVADAALALDVLAGYEPGDPGMAPRPVRPFVHEVQAPDPADADRLHLGICRQTPYTPDGLDTTSVAALDATMRLLEDLGHEVEEITLPVPDALAANMLTLWAAIVAAQPFDPATYEPVNAWLAEVGRSRSAADYAAAHFQLQLQARRIVQATSHLDAVVLPVLTAPSRANDHYLDWPGKDVFTDQTALVGLTPLANLTGQPAISLPLYHHDTAGPIGVQFLGRPWDEAGLLRLAAQLEAAAPWHDRLPELSASSR